MKSIPALLTLVLLSTFSSAAEPRVNSISESATADKPSKPNIVFIFTDDHAYQSISCYGSRINKTPNIDRIASEGMRFDRCYVTNSICGPMRAVIQTGKYSHLNGFVCNGNKFDGTQQIFPRLLQGAGYQTAVVGKWHLGTHMKPQGFDYSEVLIGQGPYYNPPMMKNGEKQITLATRRISSPTSRSTGWTRNAMQTSLSC